MSSGAVITWVVFLIVAPLVLWWLYRSNVKRGESLADWAKARGWTYSDRTDDVVGLLTAEAFAPRTVWTREETEPKEQGDHYVVRGSRNGREVLGWEHFHSSGAVGQRRPGPVQAVAVRLRSTPPAFQATPDHAGIRLMAGNPALAELAPPPEVGAHWITHGDPAVLALVAPVLAEGMPRIDVVAVRVENGVVAAWFQGQTRAEHIEPTADWLTRLADAIDA